MNKSLKITILVALCLLLLSIMIMGLFDKAIFIFSDFNKNAETVYEESFDLNNIKNIIVSTVSSDVKFVQSDDNQVKVLIKSNKNDNYNVKLDKDLNINIDNKNRICFGFCFYNSEVIISIPKNIEKEISVKTVSGEVKADVDMNNKLNAHSTSGDIDIKRAKNADIKTVSGDVKLLYSEKINIETTSGDVEIVEANLNENSRIKTISGEVSINKTNDIYIDTKTTSGEVSINSNNRHALVSLNIITTSGDINVEN